MRILLLFCIIIFFISASQAGITGKIRGKITDSETKQPVIGVSVLLLGTTMGGVANSEGEYFILNIPVGKYSLRASAVGYNSTTTQNVQVSADLTSEINFNIFPSSIEQKEIIIIAQRPLIQQDITSAVTVVGAEQLQSFPVTSFTQAMILSNSVVETKNGTGEGIHLRGGRVRETSYIIDGVRADNILFSGLASDVPRLGVSSLTVMSGTFNAEYGQAQSGIINVVTQDGTEQWGAVARYSSDAFGGNKNNWGTHNTEFSLSGPVLDGVSVFVSGDRQLTNSYLNTSEGPTYYSPGGRKIQHDFNFDLFDTKNRAQAKLTVKPLPELKIQLGAVYYHRKFREYDQSFKEYPQFNGQKINESLLGNFSLTHTISQSTYYEVRYSYFDYKEKEFTFDEQLNGDHSRVFAPVLGNVSFDSTSNYIFYAPYSAFLMLNEALRQGYTNLKLADTIHVTLATGDTVLEEGSVVNAEVFHLLNEGHRNYAKIKVSLKVNSIDDSFRDARTISRTLAFNISSQVDDNNNVKFGIESKEHSIRDYWINGVNTYWDHIDNAILFNDRHYDITDYTFSPYQLSTYVQDKFEYKNMVFNVGVRYDYLNVKAPDVYELMLLNPTNPRDSATYVKVKSEKVPQRSKISPRFGFAFPITTKAKIHFSYGHFFQYPDFNFLYRRFYQQNPNYLFLGIGKSTDAIGNPKLKPETTHAYELGGEYILNDNMVMGVRMFYKDTYDYIATQPLFTPDNHTRIANLDYANSRGIEFTLERRFANHYSFGLNYTFSRAEGNADVWSTHSNEVWNASVYGYVPAKKTVTLAWDQPHTLTMNFRLDYDSWGGSVIGDVGSGLPYTPREPRGKPLGDINSGRQPWTGTFDMRVYHKISINPFVVMLTLDIENIFDKRNIYNVFDSTGKPDYNSNPSATAESMDNPSFFGPLRHFIFGLEIEY